MDGDLLNLIRKHEGFRASAYRDTRGYLTIGYGRLIDARRGDGARALSRGRRLHRAQG